MKTTTRIVRTYTLTMITNRLRKGYSLSVRLCQGDSAWNPSKIIRDAVGPCVITYTMDRQGRIFARIDR